MSLQPETPENIDINGITASDRWLVYQRLQELEIPCQCEIYQPLRVQIPSSQTAIQLWSTIRSLTASRPELINFLKRCWELN